MRCYPREPTWGFSTGGIQAPRKAIAKRVKDNLAYLKRKGTLLGVIPQGYRRENGAIVEDPDAGPIIRNIFTLYATGNFGFAP